MPEFRDAQGVQWSVRRRWWTIDTLPDPGYFGNDQVSTVVGALLLLVWLPLALAWPFWFLAKLCGVPWKIVVTRNKDRIYTKRVRGWSASDRRIDEIVQSLRDGTQHFARQDSA